MLVGYDPPDPELEGEIARRLYYEGLEQGSLPVRRVGDILAGGSVVAVYLQPNGGWRHTSESRSSRRRDRAYQVRVRRRMHRLSERSGQIIGMDQRGI